MLGSYVDLVDVYVVACMHILNLYVQQPNLPAFLCDGR